MDRTCLGLDSGDNRAPCGLVAALPQAALDSLRRLCKLRHLCLRAWSGGPLPSEYFFFFESAAVMLAAVGFFLGDLFIDLKRPGASSGTPGSLQPGCLRLHLRSHCRWVRAASCRASRGSMEHPALHCGCHCRRSPVASPAQPLMTANNARGILALSAGVPHRFRAQLPLATEEEILQILEHSPIMATGRGTLRHWHPAGRHPSRRGDPSHFPNCESVQRVPLARAFALNFQRAARALPEPEGAGCDGGEGIS